MHEHQARSGRGRQVEAARNDAAVLKAAREVFADHGPDAPVSLLAEAAGVGVATLYRRFPNKESLLQHLCRSSLAEQSAAVDDAMREPDAALALDRYVLRCVAMRVGAFSALAGRFRPDPELARAAAAAHRSVEKLVARAQADGRLRPDANAVDIHELVSLFSSRPASDGAARLLALALAGLRPGAGALPGRPRAWKDYAAAWQAEPPTAE